MTGKEKTNVGSVVQIERERGASLIPIITIIPYILCRPFPTPLLPGMSQ